jgi:hypothetical protein
VKNAPPQFGQLGTSLLVGSRCGCGSCTLRTISVGAVDCILNNEVIPPPKRFADYRLDLPPGECSNVGETALAIEFSRNDERPDRTSRP